MVKTIEATDPIMAKYPATVTIQYFMKNRPKRPKNFYCGFITVIDSDVDMVNVITEVGILQNVPVDYMACDSAAFATGDHALIYCQNCDLSRATVIGFCTGTKVCPPTFMEDSLVALTHPNTKYGNANVLNVTIQNVSIIQPTIAVARTFIKTIQYTNKVLHVYFHATAQFGVAYRAVGAYGVDPDDWDEATLTWNNQPSLGVLLDSNIINATGWWSWDIGSADSVCLKFVDESLNVYPPSLYIDLIARSREHGSDIPYLTEA